MPGLRKRDWWITFVPVHTRLTISAIAIVVLGATADGQVDPNSSDPLPLIQSVPNGFSDVAALDLPQEFLRHVADWELRTRFRAVFHRMATDPPVASPTLLPIDPNAQDHFGLTIRRVPLESSLVKLWVSQPFGVPNLRGYRAAMLDAASDPWPIDVIATQNADAYRNAATYVAQHLARDGLIHTTMNVMRQTNLPWLRDDSLNLAKLRAVGVPIDWFDFFTIDGKPLTTALAQWMDAGAPTSGIEAIADRAKFAFRPSCPGFKVLAEDGSEPIGAIRLQLPTNRFVYGVGDGSVLDVFRQLAQQQPSRELWVSIHEQGMDDLITLMRTWKIGDPARITIVPHPANITQWAQDNAKTGLAPANHDSDGLCLITLVPRFASRTELRSEFVPSDSFVFETLGRNVLDVAPSPLLFQGGNLLPIVDPKSGARILLIGEAEIYRNRALGLSAEQVTKAFAIEFGVDRSEVLSATSFHIDLDLTVRRCGTQLVASVNDDVAGSRMIAEHGVRALAAGGVIDPQRVPDILKSLDQGPVPSALGTIRAAIAPSLDDHGVFEGRFTSIFTASAPESAAANALRFLVALDILEAHAMNESQLNDSSAPAAWREYMKSLQRQEQAVARLITKLEHLGMRVHRIPGLCEHQISINHVNGVQFPNAYLMPTCGGFFQVLDDAAQQEFSKAYGSAVTVQPIHAAAMQASDGGLHCLINVYPARHETATANYP